MTVDTYNKYNTPQYRGKHEKQWYNVYRVLGPAGPEEEIRVYGRQEALNAILGCWDYEVRNERGEVVA
jgi:hypothetical protein